MTHRLRVHEAAARDDLPSTSTCIQNGILGQRLRDAFAAGIAYLTEDRKEAGLLLEKPLRENLTLAVLERFGGWRIDTAAEDAALDRATADFDIRAPSRSMAAGKLSGGNQQKLLLAKTMLTEPRIVIIDEPTRGIDVGTKRQIYAFIRRLAEEGRFDALLIESTGISEPMPVAATFDFRDEAGRSLGDLARLDTMVTVVDAANLTRDFSSHDVLSDLGESLGGGDDRTLGSSHGAQGRRFRAVSN